MRVLSPRCSSSAWGSGNRRRSPQRTWLWKPVVFDPGNSTGLGTTETPLLEAVYKVLCTPRPRKISCDLIWAQTRPTCWCWRVSCGSGEYPRLTVGQRHWQQKFWVGSSHWHDPFWRSPFSHQDLAPPSNPWAPVLGHLRTINQHGWNIAPTHHWRSYYYKQLYINKMDNLDRVNGQILPGLNRKK